MTNDIYQTLSTRYIPEKPLKTYSSIATEEKGIHYRANIIPPRDAAMFQVDGCIITSGQKCDKLLLSKNPSNLATWFGHFIELKGTDVSHAIDQLETTIRNPLFNDNSLVKKFARIIARSFPSSKGDPLVERARIRFKQQYQCELKTLKSQNPDTV